jgi:hypothetical protein
MYEPHEGTVDLRGTFDWAYDQLRARGEVSLATSAGTEFSARAAEAERSVVHAGERVVRFFENDLEYGRAYRCCWGHYYNCSRTRIGMYCSALDALMHQGAREAKNAA